MTESLPGASSSARKLLPRAGPTPSSSNRSADTTAPVMRSGPLASVNVAVLDVNAAIRSKTVF